MAILHGSWRLKNGKSYFFIWGETWRTAAGIEFPVISESVLVHPFHLHRQELLAFLQSHPLNSPLDWEEIWTIETITLPSYYINKSQQIAPLLSNQLSIDRPAINGISWRQWQIQGLELNPLEAIAFFQQLPLNILPTETNYVGSDLQFWHHVYRWCLDLLARGKFLPGVVRQQTEEVSSSWHPLLDSTVDQSRWAKFTQLMPAACRAYGDRCWESQALLLDFINKLINTQLRQWLPSLPNLAKITIKQPWLQSLSQVSAKLQLKEAEIKQLEIALDNWTLSIQEYLATPDNKQLGINQFRVCFCLKPVPQNPENSTDINWQLEYYLQALDDSEFLISGQTIWQNPLEELIFQGRKIKQPQETFLKGLGLASRIYGAIADSLQEEQPQYCKLNPIQVYEFIRAIAWQLQDSGLGVILPPSLASGAQEKRLGLKIQAEVTSQKGERLSLKSLLKYELKLAIGDQVISQKEFERLLAQKSPLVELNGEWIALQPADVRGAQAILNQSHEPIQLSVEDALRLSTGDAQTIAKLPVMQFEASGILQEFITNLTNNQTIKLLPNPPDFQGKLRPYQARGVSWLAFLEKWGLGACLADDMGLGKTPQLLAFLLHLKAEDMSDKPILIVCPTSVINNWEREIKKFAPTLSAFIHHGENRSKGKNFVQETKRKELVITSYSIAYRDAKTLQEVEWQGVVLDEAQNIKNPQAKQSQAVRQLKARFRVALTGTPVENHLSDLWSILDFLNPGFLGTQQFFQRRFATPIEKYGDRESLQILRSLVQPFILRRLKTDREIIQDLPEKQEINVFCGLSLEQAELYQKLVDRSLAEIENATGIQRRGLILTLLLKLKQVCNHPAQFLKENSLQNGEHSGKLLRLQEMLEEVIEEGDRTLIFTQFAEWGKLLQPYLEQKLNREVIFLYGGTRRQQRQEMIDRFQNDPDGPPIFILSLKAGGTGLNLTRANHVFHVDRWWNPAVENQATDRAFRIGQKRNVQVYKFVCTGTLEEKINDMLESKKQLAEQTVDAGEQWLTELDTDQLRNLLLLDRNAIIDE